MNQKDIKLFISYSHKDEVYKDLLISHLAPLKRRGIIKEWNDRQIIPGENWDGKIKEELISSHIVLLLISADFLNSNYCYDIEVTKAVELHKLDYLRIIPIILRSCDWRDLPFSNIQALPKDAQPLSKWKDIDEGFLDIINGIKKVISLLQLKDGTGFNSVDDGVIEDELGLMDYEELIEDLLSISSNHLGNLTTSMNWFSDEINKKTGQITSYIERKQTNRKEIKDLFSKTAIIMNNFADEIEPEITNHYESFTKLMFYYSGLFNVYGNDFQTDNDEMVNTNISLNSLKESISNTKETMKDFLSSINSLPRMTKEINSAKTKISKNISTLISNLDDNFSKVNDLVTTLDLMTDN